jgi:hypothetical protein
LEKTEVISLRYNSKKEAIQLNKWKPYCQTCKKMIMNAKQKRRRYCDDCIKKREIIYKKNLKRRKKNANKSD